MTAVRQAEEDISEEDSLEAEAEEAAEAAGKPHHTSINSLSDSDNFR